MWANQKDVAAAIGSVVIAWGHIEGNVRRLVDQLIVNLDPAFDREEVEAVTRILVSNMDLRQSIATAKALSHLVKNPSDFYERAEPLLSRIDNRLRTQRNRYVHDEWFTWKVVSRVRMGAVVKQEPSTGKRVLHNLRSEQLTVEDLQEFNQELASANQELGRLDSDLRGATAERDFQTHSAGPQRG